MDGKWLRHNIWKDKLVEDELDISNYIVRWIEGKWIEIQVINGKIILWKMNWDTSKYIVRSERRWTEIQVVYGKINRWKMNRDTI